MERPVNPPPATISMATGDLLDLQSIVRRIYNTAQGVLHRPENGDDNEHFTFIARTDRSLSAFVHAQAEDALTCIASKRGIMVDVPETLLNDMQHLTHHLRAVTTEELGRIDLGHIEPKDRNMVRQIQRSLNPDIFEQNHTLRRDTLNDSSGWQEQIDCLIDLARKRPEPLKQLESLADITAEIIDLAAAAIDFGADTDDKIGLRAMAIKRDMLNECRRKPYTITPKLLQQCASHIERMEGLAQGGLVIANAMAPNGTRPSNFNVAIERCQQFKALLGELQTRDRPR